MKRLILFSILLSVLLCCTSPLSAQRNLKDIPDPDPELERKSFIVADGFEVNLFAADPLLAKPIQMNFDAQGRLWVASSEIYPHIKPGQKANDKILILEDRDHDGRADKTTVFADGLLIPTGVVPGDGGAYVANSTELLHLKDTDGDGKADRRKIVLSGFGAEDTHHILHTLRWGHDGALYMNQSIYIHSHIETPYGVRRLNGGGIWQFRPETMQLEILCRGFVNPWGHHFDRWGQSFATDGAYGEGINYVFPGSVFVTAPGAKRRLQGLNPGSPKHCSLEILSGGHLPADWQGNMITNDFRAHRVCRFVISEDGSGYASRQEVELIKTKHVAFRPIDVKMGPDGAIYIADWYNPIIQHGEVDFRDPRRDHVHGRIWRVTAKGRPTLKPAKLVGASTDELLAMLKTSENWNRLYAKLILKSRGADKVLAPLQKWIAALDPKDADYDHHRLEALWVYQNLNHVEPALLGSLLKSSDHRVRSAAVRVASQWRERLDNEIAIFRDAVIDDHPRVRLEAVRGLSQIQSSQAATLAMQTLDRPMDRFLDFALWQTMRDLQSVWLPEVRSGKLDFGGNVEQLTFALRSVDSPTVVGPLLDLIRNDKIPADRVDGVLTLIATMGGPKELGAILDMALSSETAMSAAGKAKLLQTLVETTQRRKLRPAGDLNRLAKLLSADNAALAASATQAAGVWKLASLQPTIAQRATDQKVDPKIRLAAIDGLASLGGRQNAVLLEKISKTAAAFADRRRAVGALASLDATTSARLAVNLLENLPTDADPNTVIGPFMSLQQGPAALIAALKDRKLKSDVAKLTLRAVQQSVRQSPELIAALRTAGGLAEAGWKLTPALSQALVEEVKTHGNAARGEAIYRRAQLQCSKCHAIGGAGGKVGPDLVSIGASAQVDYLLDSLIEPNKKIKENFHSVVVQTDDGKVLTGIVVRKTKTEWVIRDAEDRMTTIPADSIEASKDGRSLMPDGAADVLTRSELVDVVRFLSELGKVGKYQVGKARVVRRWQVLEPTKEATFRIRRTSFDTAATEDPAFAWKPAYSRVQGELPLAELPPFRLPAFVTQKKSEGVVFLRFHLDVTTPGQVALALGSTGGLRLWIDGKPTPPRAITVLDLKQGRHTATLAVILKQAGKALKAELQDVQGSPAQASLVSGK